MFWRSLSLVGKHIRSPRRQFGLLVGTSSAAAIAEVISVGLAVRAAVLAAAGASGGVTLIGHQLPVGGVLALALGSAFGTIVLHVLNARIASRLNSSIVENVRVQCYDAFANARWSVQASQGEGALQDLLTAISTSTGVLALALTTFLAQLATLIVFIGAASVVQPIATATFVVVGILTLSVLRPLARRARRAASSYVQAERRFADTASQVNASAMESKVFGVQDQVGDLVRRDASALQHDAEAMRFAVAVNSYLYKDLAIVFLVLVVAGIYAVTVSSFTAVSVVIALLVRAISAAQQSNAQYQLILEYSPTVEVADERIASLRSAGERFGGERLAGFREMTFQAVSYTYDGAETPAVAGIDFELRVGEVVGLSGPSGAGKSTIAQIALRLRRPTNGSVIVDGRDYGDFSPEEWASSVGFVPQEPSLVEGTVRENILYFRDLKEEDVVAAARLANIHDEIMALPGGYGEQLGPRGSGLSGGQKQRLAIARALAAKPTLLVMDEPTSALDAVSESAVVGAIDAMRQECAVLVVTHRPSTEVVCDRVIPISRQSIPQP